MNDSLDSVLDTDDILEETEEEIEKVLAEVAVETTKTLPTANRRVSVKQSAEAEVLSHHSCPYIPKSLFSACIADEFCCCLCASETACR